MSTDSDIVVVGAGMVGATLAVALAQRGFTVTVVDGGGVATMPTAAGYDARVSAISRASQTILTRLGVWQRLPAARVQAYRGMRVWDANSEGELCFDSTELGEPDLGHIVENRAIVAALHAVASDQPTLNAHYGRTVTAVQQLADAVVVTLDNGERLTAELVVAADGARSTVRALAGIEVLRHDYLQRAITATLRLADGHQETAWQRFLATGPVAILPLPGAAASLVWSTALADAEALMALADDVFAERLSAALGERLGAITLAGERKMFPLYEQRAETYLATRMALVGDAAHSIHPMAGQGVNLGLLDAAELLDVLADARDRHKAIGAHAVLRRYERARQGHNQLTSFGMRGLDRVFALQQPRFNQLRGVGMRVVDRVPPLKNSLMRQAMGLHGELPSLARAY